MPGQLYGVNTLGGFTTNNELSKQMRVVAQPLKRFRQFVQVKGAKGKNRGDKLFYDKYQNVQTQGTTLTETTPIPETNFIIKQGTLSITEYGNAIPWTGKLEALTEQDVNNAVTTALRNDYAKVLDSAAAAQFTSAEFKAVMVTTASVNYQRAGTASATATADLTGANWRTICDQMRKDIIPFYDGSSYMVIGSVNLLSGFYNDVSTAGFVDVSKYTSEFAGQLFRGEIGRYYMGRFMEETDFLPNNIGNGTTHGGGVAFGADAMMEGVAIPEELRQKVPTDYGRSQGLAWYFLGGWQKIWDETNDADERIVHITSL